MVEKLAVLLEHVAQGRFGAGAALDLFGSEREDRQKIRSVRQLFEQGPHTGFDHLVHEIGRRLPGIAGPCYFGEPFAAAPGRRRRRGLRPTA